MPKLLWTQKAEFGPKPRVRHAMAFDSQASRVILFGGDSLNGSVFGDTWSWDGENWTQLEDLGPTPRHGHALAFDAARHRTVLFGGTVAGTSMRDTWEWDSEYWTQVSANGPSARSGHAMAFDASRGRVVLFGGLSAEGSLSDETWEWDGDEWVQQQDVGPMPRQQHALAFDASRSRVVLFGGINADSNALGDTWEWDGATWTEVAAFGPDPAFGPTLVSKGARASLYGGASAPLGSPTAPTIFALTWEWNGRHWTVRQDMGPGPRIHHAMAYDSARGRSVLFGGVSVPHDGTPDPSLARGDTWEQFDAVGPAQAEVALESVSVEPEPSVIGDEVTIAVTMSEPVPGPAEQVVQLTVQDAAAMGSVLATIDISVPQGSAYEQITFALTAEIAESVGAPVELVLVGTAGGVTRSAAWTITA